MARDAKVDDVFVRVDLDAQTMAHYERRAQAAGRTLDEQLVYELEVNHGLRVPDPGDTEATEWAQLFRRMTTHRVLHG